MATITPVGLDLRIAISRGVYWVNRHCPPISVERNLIPYGVALTTWSLTSKRAQTTVLRCGSRREREHLLPELDIWYSGPQ